jgi:hypothetical protein
MGISIGLEGPELERGDGRAATGEPVKDLSGLDADRRKGGPVANGDEGENT